MRSELGKAAKTVVDTNLRVKQDGTLTTAKQGRPGHVKRNSPRDLAQDFTSKFIAHFRKNGIKAIETVFETNPVEYLKVATRLLPKDVNLTIEHTFSDVLAEAHEKISRRIADEKTIEGTVFKTETDT